MPPETNSYKLQVDRDLTYGLRISVVEDSDGPLAVLHYFY